MQRSLTQDAVCAVMSERDALRRKASTCEKSGTGVQLLLPSGSVHDVAAQDPPEFSDPTACKWAERIHTKYIVATHLTFYPESCEEHTAGLRVTFVQ